MTALAHSTLAQQAGQARAAMIQRLEDIERRYLAMGKVNAAQMPRNMAEQIRNGSPAFLYRNWTEQLERMVRRDERDLALLVNANLPQSEIEGMLG